jgi:hypothetical protein
MAGVGTIRFGLTCDSPVLAAWQARCLQQLRDIPGVELALIVTPAAPAGPPAGSAISAAHRGGPLWRLCQAWMDLRTPALGAVDLTESFAGTPRVAAVDVAGLRAQALDFLLHFGTEAPSIDLLTVARHGVWAYHHGNPEEYYGGPAAFWEVSSGAPCTTAVLHQITASADHLRVLRRGTFQTEPSHRRNLQGLLHASSGFAAEVCRELMETGRLPEEAAPVATAPARSIPTDLEVLHSLLGTALRTLRSVARRCLVWQWNIGVLSCDVGLLLTGRHVIGHQVQWVTPKPGGFRADPCILRCDDNVIHVLAEDFTYAEGKGTITKLSISPSGQTLSESTILDTPHHLAYPHVTRLGDDTFFVPESALSNEITAYRYDAAGDRWRGQPLLRGIRAIDPTLLRFHDCWWLFYTDLRISDTDNLCIAWSDDLRGPWTGHPRNPVKRDVRSSRPAGAFLVVDGQLYRPAQDCSGHYGQAISMNKVSHLSKEEYFEEEVARIEPDPASPYPSGLHTISAVDGRVVIDGLRLRFAPWLKILLWRAEHLRS